MARIKHIALSTDDPAKTAEFYKNVFGLTELRRQPADTGAEGVLTPVYHQPFGPLSDAAAIPRNEEAAGTLSDCLHRVKLPGQDSNLEKQDQNLL